MDLQALIFDVDGTLAETEEMHRRAFNEAFMALSVNRDWPDERRSWIWDAATYARLLKTAGGKERIASYLRHDLGMATDDLTTRIADIHRAKTRRYAELVAGGALELRDGIRDLVAAARAAGLKLAVATTTSPANVDALCRACFGEAAHEVFDVIAAGEDVSRKKPAPDVYELAIDRLGLAAPGCIALEDSQIGVHAAKSAGLFCVASPSSYLKGDDLSAANLVVSEFSDVTLTDVVEAVGASNELKGA